MQSEREPLVDVEEVCRFTGMTRNGYYSLRHQGGGPPAYRIGRRLMHRWSEVEAWVASRGADPQSAA